MTNKRKVIGAKRDKDGNITGVLLEGNVNFISSEKAHEMAKKGIVDLVAVETKNNKYIRTRPDGEKGNNLDEMADD
ncbi:DUF3892 domain-containing protein [Marinomonas pollencensis]|uniref:Uncharacterized protein DUF3892 n=1 Tax=Marinomonas pollencensis TaxID=491954 RepID=A0A3E0DW50_9GAMM|nr:DUF3892 domain-containing protein [Marinomonas pollencensis]REG86734.1 uncharacterized protein DUF3892 [Marinomonas pollencensis]